MYQTPRAAVMAAFVLAIGAALYAQDKPALHQPKTPTTREQLDRREALRLFGLGAMQERGNRLVQAVASFEKARRLDPESAAINRALVPLYLGLDRVGDAMEASKQTLKFDPDDYQTAGQYARLLRDSSMNAEAVAVLTGATKSKTLKERPDIAAQVWFDLGGLQHVSGDLKAALASFRKMAEIFDNPATLLESTHLTREEILAQSAETHERIGRVCLEAGDADGAAKAFEVAQKRDPSRAGRLALNLAQVYQGQKKYKEALAQVETFVATLPQGTEGYELKIALLRKLGQEKEVVSELEASGRRDPNNLALQLLLAREYRGAFKRDEAEKLYLGLLERNLLPEVYKGLFDLYRDEKGGAEKVLDRFDRAIKKGLGEGKGQGNGAEAAHARVMYGALKDDKTLVGNMVKIAVARLDQDEKKGLAPTTRGFLATLAARTKQLPQAEKLYRSCLDKGPAEAEADVYAGLIRVLRLQYKHEDVAEVCKTALAKAENTNRLWLHIELGRALQYVEKDAEAAKAFEAAVAAADSDQKLTCKRLHVESLTALGKHDAALAECQALAKEYTEGDKLRDVRMMLAAVYQGMNKHELADKQHQLILETDPNDVTANNNLGYTWAERNMNLEEAEKLIRKAIELDRQNRTGVVAQEDEEDSAAYVDSLAWVLFRRNKLTEARAELEKAVKLPGGDDDPTVWDHLGDVYWRQGEKDKATAAWKTAISLYDRRTRRMHAERYKEIQGKLEAK